MQTIKAAQLSEDDFFGTAINKDIMEIDQANHFEGSAEEAKVAMSLGQLGIKYNKITKEEFVTLIGILRKSDLLKSPGSKRGKSGRKKR